MRVRDSVPYLKLCMYGHNAFVAMLKMQEECDNYGAKSVIRPPDHDTARNTATNGLAGGRPERSYGVGRNSKDRAETGGGCSITAERHRQVE